MQYRIIDPVKYRFGNRNPALALRDVAQIVMRSAVGDHTVTEVLRRAEIVYQVQMKMQELLNLYETGLRVETVRLQSVAPPSDEVKRAFNEVNEAQQERERKENEARQVYNQEIPRERGGGRTHHRQGRGLCHQPTNTAKGMWRALTRS